MYHVIQLPNRLNALPQHYQLDDAGQVVEVASISLLDLQEKLKGCMPAILLPGQKVTTHAVTMPKTQAKELQRALPFAVEDCVASDVDELYCAAGTYVDNKQYVAIVDQAYFDTIFQFLKETNWTIASVMPDYFAYPYEEGGWSLVFNAEQVLWRYGLQLGASIPLNEFAAIWPLIYQQHADALPGRIDIYGSEAEYGHYFSVCAKLVTWHDQAPSWDINGIFDKPVLSLLQGSYRLKAQRSLLKKRWLQAGKFALASLVLVLLMNVGALFYVDHEYARVTEQQKAIGQHLGLVYVNGAQQKAQMSHLVAKIQSMYQEDGFLNILSRTITLFKAHQEWSVRTIAYEKNQLIVTLKGSALADIAPLINAFRAKGLTVLTHKLSSKPSNLRYQVILRRAA
jgi:general secretion pathway protein L